MEEIQTFFDEHGRRPTCREMGSLRLRLHRMGSSLKEVCDEMGLPSKEDLADERNRNEVQAFFVEHGRRPLSTELKVLDTRLNRRGSSLKKLCDEMGLPSRQDSFRVQALEMVREFFADHGRRPRVREMCNLHHRLYAQGSSLMKICDEAGLPPRKRRRAS